MERPNTVAGLIEKRRELIARRKLAEADIKAFTSGIDAIDIVLKLFGSEIDTVPSAFAPLSMIGIGSRCFRTRITQPAEC